MCIRRIINNNNSSIKHPIRKSRTKTRRPKFLSLRLELISPQITPMTHNPPSPQPPPPPPPPPMMHKQLTLFPLHPENLVEDREENVALIFENDVVSTCCTLQSFLPSYQNDMSSSVSSEGDSRNLAEDAALVRAAIRSREREAGAEEKWVCYSEVVEEVTSTAADDEWVKKKMKNKKKKIKIKKKVEMIGKQLRLKLDYQGILNAWSDKAPLFINGESPQTVPNLHDDPTLCSDSLPNRCMMDGIMGSEVVNNNNNDVWKVPEMGLKKEESILEGREGWKMGQREASVLRYKEKRQSRLFSKRIRYEVRKLNAEKRPRMKGRFVKRS